MSMLLMRRALMGGAPDIALQTILSKDAPAFYLPDPNPALRMPSSLRRGYQDFANTPVTASTQTAALALDLSEGAAIGADQAVNGGFDADTDWNKATGVTIGSGVCTFSSVSSASGISQDEGDWTGGELIRLTLDINTLTAGFFRAKAGGSGALVNFPASTGRKTIYLIAGSASAGRIEILAAGTTSGVIDNVEYEVISGNHFYQATSADEPTLTFANGQWGYVGDGTSKHFKTGLVPASSMTMMAAVSHNTTNDYIMGAIDSGGGPVRCTLVVDAAGKIGAQVGTQTEGLIVGGSDTRNIPGIAALRFNGSAVSLFWQPVGGAISTLYSAAQAGSVPTSHPLYVLARNNTSSSSDGWFSGTAFRAFAQQSYYTEAEIAAIANQWSRELGALA